MDECLARYNIPTDLPLIAQVSRFDPWKDPEGVIRAFKLARRKVDCTLVLLGNFATDDPEGERDIRIPPRAAERSVSLSYPLEMILLW